MGRGRTEQSAVRRWTVSQPQIPTAGPARVLTDRNYPAYLLSTGNGPLTERALQVFAQFLIFAATGCPEHLTCGHVNFRAA